MMDKKKRKKGYEPPIIQEIGGSFEQAMGVSNCLAGSKFIPGPCTKGGSALGGCLTGNKDMACNKGATDFGSCSKGNSAAGGCIAGNNG